MSRGRRLLFSLALVVGAALLVPSAALAGGNDVAHNLASWLRGAAAQIYGGIIALVGLNFLVNRRYTDLGLFFVAAVLVGWLVFSPDQVANAAREIGKQVLP
jgi:hypothetical protein